MKATTLYRIGRIDQDGTDYLSDDVLDAVDAAGHLALEHALLVIAGWDVRRCKCGWSLTGTKGDLRRTVVALPVDDIESLALAVGVLSPASLDGRLAVV